MRRVRSTLLVLLLTVGCGRAGDDDAQTEDLGAANLFTGEASVSCDGDASLFDWLVVFEAEVADEVVDLEAEVIQRGSVFGPVDLNEVRQGDWYGEVWEDDLGMDCEGSEIGATFYAIASDGAEQILDL